MCRHGCGARYQMRKRWPRWMKMYAIAARHLPSRSLTAWLAPGLTGHGKVAISPLKMMHRHIMMKWFLCCLCRWRLQIPRSGLIQVCIGPMVLMAQARDIFTLITKLAKWCALNLLTSIRSHMPVLFSLWMMIWSMKAGLWIYGFVKPDYSNMALAQVRTSHA